MEERLAAVGGQVLFGVLAGDIVRGGGNPRERKKAKERKDRKKKGSSQRTPS